MLQDQVTAVGNLGLCEAEPSQYAARHLRTALRVIASTDGLADVVQQRRQIQYSRSVYFSRQPRGQRLISNQLTSGQSAQAIDGRDRVNVDRVHVINIVMNAAYD